jgi:hypothetical protein
MGLHKGKKKNTVDAVMRTLADACWMNPDALILNQNAVQLAVDTAICVLDIDGHYLSCPQVIEKGQ